MGQLPFPVRLRGGDGLLAGGQGKRPPKLGQIGRSKRGGCRRERGAPGAARDAGHDPRDGAGCSGYPAGCWASCTGDLPRGCRTPGTVPRDGGTMARLPEGCRASRPEDLLQRCRALGTVPEDRVWSARLSEGRSAPSSLVLPQGWGIQHLSRVQGTGKHPRGRGTMHQTPCRMSGITSQGLSPGCWVAGTFPGDRTLCPGHFTGCRAAGTFLRDRASFPGDHPRGTEVRRPFLGTCPLPGFPMDRAPVPGRAILGTLPGDGTRCTRYPAGRSFASSHTRDVGLLQPPPG